MIALEQDLSTGNEQEGALPPKSGRFQHSAGNLPVTVDLLDVLDGRQVVEREMGQISIQADRVIVLALVIVEAEVVGVLDVAGAIRRYDVFGLDFELGLEGLVVVRARSSAVFSVE